MPQVHNVFLRSCREANHLLLRGANSFGGGGFLNGHGRAPETIRLRLPALGQTNPNRRGHGDERGFAVRRPARGPICAAEGRVKTYDLLFDDNPRRRLQVRPDRVRLLRRNVRSLPRR